MNLQDIHEMSADALAGEELQVRNNNEDWFDYKPTKPCLFDSQFDWRIKPTIEVNGVMMTKRQAKAAWEASGATSYECKGMVIPWHKGLQSTPSFIPGSYYYWQKPKWIYVNGEKIVPFAENSTRKYMGFGVATEGDIRRFSVALKALIEIK